MNRTLLTPGISTDKNAPVSLSRFKWMPLWAGGSAFLILLITFPAGTHRFFVPSGYPNIGWTGPLAFGSAVLCLLSASAVFFLLGRVRTHFASDTSLLKRSVCLLSLALGMTLTLAGQFIILLGPAALSMMDMGLWQSR